MRIALIALAIVVMLASQVQAGDMTSVTLLFSGELFGEIAGCPA